MDGVLRTSNPQQMSDETLLQLMAETNEISIGELTSKKREDALKLINRLSNPEPSINPPMISNMSISMIMELKKTLSDDQKKLHQLDYALSRKGSDLKMMTLKRPAASQVDATRQPEPPTLWSFMYSYFSGSPNPKPLPLTAPSPEEPELSEADILFQHFNRMNLQAKANARILTSFLETKWTVRLKEVTLSKFMSYALGVGILVSFSSLLVPVSIFRGARISILRTFHKNGRASHIFSLPPQYKDKLCLISDQISNTSSKASNGKKSCHVLETEISQGLEHTTGNHTEMYDAVSKDQPNLSRVLTFLKRSSPDDFPLLARMVEASQKLLQVRQYLSEQIIIGQSGINNSGKSLFVRTFFEVDIPHGIDEDARTTVPFMYHHKTLPWLKVIDFPGVNDKVDAILKITKQIFPLVKVSIFFANAISAGGKDSAEFPHLLEQVLHQLY